MGEASLKRPLRCTAGLSCVQLFAAPWTAGRRLLCPWNSAGRNTGEGCHALLQGMPPTQESNSGLLNCKRILYCLSHKGNPRILEWVAYPFSRESSWPRKWTGVSCTAGRFFTSWATREALSKSYIMSNSSYMTFWERQNYEDSSCQEFSGREVEMNSRSIGDFHRAVRLFWKILWVWTYVTRHVLKPIQCTIRTVRPNVSYVF